MSAFETMMWRGEIHPMLRSTGTIVEILDRAPDWDRLVDAHRWATQRVPRLRERVVEPPLPVAPPMWSDDEDFDLDYHLRRLALPGPGSFRQLLDAACSFGHTPLDRARPQWESMLIEGLEGGRAAYVLKFHHSLTDGHGLIQLLSRTHAEQRVRPEPRPTPSAASLERHSEMGVMWNELLAAPLGIGRLALDGLRRAAGAIANPVGSIGDAVAFARSLKRVMAPVDVERSPLLSRGTGLGWRFVAHEVALDQLKAGAKAGGGSLNDGFVAALLGAIRRYHDHFGVVVDRIPMGMPVSVRAENDASGGNKFAAAKFAAPMGERDPRERIRLVRELVLSAREEPAISAIDSLAPLLSRLPARAITEMTIQLTTSLDLQASNIPGLTRSAYLSGAKVTHVYAFGPRPGCAMMMALISHDGRCCIAGNVDPEAIADPDLFEKCLADAFQEIVDLAVPS
jgi:WS/DGAT/MGAT family acyltransferase